MTTIQSPEHLLQHVARKGDPSAFYSLVAPFAHATYQEIRNSGKNHKDTMLLLVPFLKKLYRGFPKKSDDVDFDSWYRNERKKHCDGVPESSPAASEETFLERISESDLSHLDSQMKLLFMRNYSKIQKQRRGGGFGTGSGIFGLGTTVTWVCAAACLCAAAVAFHCFLSFSHVQIAISVDSPSFRHSIHLPSAINKRLFRGSTGQRLPKAIPAAVVPDSAVPGGPVHSDSIPKAPVTAIKEPSVQSVTKPALSSARQKLPTDSVGKPQGRPQVYSSTVASQPAKPGITGTDKAGSTPGQPQKLRQDSSHFTPKLY
jgi:hypothetical protein